MAYASDIVRLAASFIGVKEDPPDSNNVVFNTHYYGQPVHDGLWGTKFPWCAAFVWDIFHMTGASELYFGGKKTASCPTLYNYHKGRGQIVTLDKAKPGDLVLFHWTAKLNADHIGILESKTDKTVTCIEGNTSVGNEGNGGMVMRRTRDKSYVLGIIHPNYEEEEINMDEVKKLIEEAKAELRREFGVPVYHTLDDVPEWGGETVKKLTDDGLLLGDGSGDLNLTADLLRVFVVLDRGEKL